MATALFGHIGEFDSESDDWTQYIERLEHYFIANEVNDANKQKSILISVCGPKAYKLMRSLTTPDKPADKTYTQLKDLMSKHHNPTPSVIVERYKFNSRFRQPGESVSEFVASLRRHSEHCNYGDNLSDMLRDRLVCGINDDHTQRRLLAETTLTFQKALDIAIAQETAVRDSKDLKQPFKSSDINKLSHKTKREQTTSNTHKTNTSVISECYRCGGKHSANYCRHRESECNFCKIKGHLWQKCKVRLSQSGKKSSKHKKVSVSHRTHLVEDLGDLSLDQFPVDEVDEYSLIHHMSEQSGKNPMKVTMNLDGSDIDMEIDTGASISLISENTHKTKWTQPPTLKHSNTTLYTYTGESIEVLGTANVSVTYQNQHKILPVVVVKGDGPSLLGRNWLKHICLDWSEIKQIHTLSSVGSTLDSILEKYNDVFKDELGTLNGFRAKIYVDDRAQPKFFKPRPLPYRLREKVEIELERLHNDGIIEPVQFSKWAAPIVPVLKSDGKSLRICGDFKVTVNSASKCDKYPLPRIEDLYAKLSGGKTFTKLDMNQAYLQILLDDDSKEYTVINTHRGLFCHNRLPFGISSSPSIFQRAMDSLVQGIPHVVVYLDDILITGETETEHLANFNEVLKRLSKAGLRLKRNKCTFQASEVVYLGHKVDAQGLHPTEEKIKAIRDAPEPSNITELRSFLGIVNYYAKFLPNLSTVLAPLHKLLNKNSTWHWNKACAKAFLSIKKMLKSSKVLVHYDPNQEIVMACDASPYGVGAVLSHVLPDGNEHPICFASRTLTAAEKNYSQLDKEGLAVIFGVKKFHQYLYGRPFKIYTDHKPLVSLFNENKTIPLMASARMLRWGLTLNAYDYSITYRPGHSNANADALSRLPLAQSPSAVPIPGDTVFLLSNLNSMFVNAKQIKQWTKENPLLSQVRDMVLHGWPNSLQDESLRPYYNRKWELSCDDDCLLWGTRIVIPPQGRKLILEQLHSTHVGISRMKSLGRSFVWWPGFDNDLENFVKSCPECQKSQNKPPVAPLHPWNWPDKPWSRLHIDYAGPFLGKMFLVVVDAHSKWMEVCSVNSATTANTINTLRQIFSVHGLPEVIVSDNGTCFTSFEFQQFMKYNGIIHITTAPYHAASNGLAERGVQIFKNGIRKVSGGSLESKLARFLFRYRITPQSTTGVSPAELLMGRKLRSHFDLLFPNVKSRVVIKQEQQKDYHDTHAKMRILNPGDLVYIYNFSYGERWIPGTILEKTGPVSYKIQLLDGRITRRHQDHVRLRYNSVPDVPTSCTQASMSAPPVVPADVSLPEQPPVDTESDDNPQPVGPSLPEAPSSDPSPSFKSPVTPPSSSPATSMGTSPESTTATPELRRSSRISKPPERLVLSM